MEDYNFMPGVPNAQLCVNCVYWQGNRRINPFSHLTSLPSVHEKGLCTKGFPGQNLHWGAGCSKFEKHPGIR